MLAEIQVLPNPPGTPDDYYRHVEAAIAVIQSSGLTYEVDALGTTLDGEPDAVWDTLRRAHEAVLAAGADSVVTVVKLAQSGESRPDATIESLTGKFREGAS
jgi:uncharacterized protein YqgV (UPF0045/DUF77 family)